jgi:glycogen synthase
VLGHVRDAHLVVLPSLWECWPNTAREALMLNRPLLATPVGGLVELAQPGRSGFLIRDTSPEALQEGIERCLDDRFAIASLMLEHGPRAVFDELADPERLLERYSRLIASPPIRPAARQRRRPPLVSIVIPYFQLEAVAEETLRSAAAQTHPSVELLLVVDGSLRGQDGPVIEAGEALGAQVVTQVNSGLGPARNFGIAQARGEYVVPLDADDLIAPEFVARCVDVLERDPSLAYVTTWVEYMRPDGEPIVDENGGWMPYGNWSRLLERNNVAGTCTALFRRELFDRGHRYSADLTSYEDWLHYLELRDAGHHGGVIPERLFRYRVREESMMRKIGAPSLGRIAGEVHALRRERAMQWEAGADRGAEVAT